MRVLAIDPGFERIGIALLDKAHKPVLVHSECFKTKSTLPFPERLLLLGTKIKNLIKEFSPDVMAVEKLYFEKNKKTALGVAEARGVIVYEGVRATLPLYNYTPLEVKVAVTGYGKATKSQVISMVPKLVVTQKSITSDDEMDAIAIGITCLARERFR